MRLLLVAADPMEFRGLLRHCSDVRPGGLAVNWSRAARLGNHRVLLATNGVGASRAARAVAAAGEVDAVASVGFCGALDPALRPGDVFAGLCVRSPEGSIPGLPFATAAPHDSGVVWSADRIVRTAAEKAELRALGASVVEMEAAGAGREARVRGLPFYCLKAVSDLAGEDLVLDFEAALRPDGQFDTIAVLRSIWKRPGKGVPEVIRLRHRCGVAAQRLGDFIADCRF
jgi:adenosylhomocysteine nucleosidase